MGKGDSRHGEGGITDYAAKTLNDIVYLTLPSVGQEVKQLSSFGTGRVNQGRLRALLAALRHRGHHEPRAREPSGANQTSRRMKRGG